MAIPEERKRVGAVVGGNSPRAVGLGRRVRLARGVGLGAALALCVAGGVQGQGVTLEARAGVALSTPLVRDAVADADVYRAIFGGPVTHLAEEVRVGARVAPVVGLAVRMALRREVSLEVAGGWTFTELVGRQGDESWRIQDLGIGHGVVALRYDVTERHHVRGGLGGIRYTSEARGLFRDGGELRPLVEVGGGVGWRAGGVRIGLDVAGQAHGFGTTAFRSAGGSGVRGADGTVFRLAVQAGITRARGRE